MLMGHSLDEVAGSFVRKALFPSSGQVCNTNKNTLNNRPRTENTLQQGKKTRLLRLLQIWSFVAYLTVSCAQS